SYGARGVRTLRFYPRSRRRFVTLEALVWRFRDERFKGGRIQKRGVRAGRVPRNWLEVRFGNCGFAVSSNAGCRDLRRVMRSGWLQCGGSRWSKAGQRRWPFVVGSHAGLRRPDRPGGWAYARRITADF